jgi:single-strand DNA-binding protein
MNKCIFIGRVGKEPEIRSMQNGNEVASFSLAVSERYKDKDGNKQEKTEWVNVVCFNKGLVSLIRGYVNKGSQIMVCGKMQTRKWQDQSGADKYTTEIVLDAFNGEIELLGGKPDGQSQHNESKSNGYQAQSPLNDDFEDDIPF